MVLSERSQNQNCKLHDSIHREFQSRQNLCRRIEIRKVVAVKFCLLVFVSAIKTVMRGRD